MARSPAPSRMTRTSPRTESDAGIGDIFAGPYSPEEIAALELIYGNEGRERLGVTIDVIRTEQFYVRLLVDRSVVHLDVL